MTTPQSTSLASTLVARFLRSNNYTQTLGTFIREAGLTADAGQSEEDDSTSKTWTIEGVLEEKKAFDATVNFERYGEKDGRSSDEWSVPAPSKPTIIQTPTASNLLAVSVEPWRQPVIESHEADTNTAYLLATGADRQLHLFSPAKDNELVKSYTGQSDSPILSYALVRNGRYMLMTNMSGQLILQRGGDVLGRRKDHAKYAVKVVASEEEGTRRVLLATAGWDAKVNVYEVDMPTGDGDGEEGVVVGLGEPVGYINLSTNPEAILFIKHIGLERTMLLVSRRDSTFLYYYRVDSFSPSSTTTPTECKLLAKQNLAPHSNAWVTFSPSGIALHPHDPGLLAVSTSTTPHMKVIIVRLLFLSETAFDDDSNTQLPSTRQPETQTTQAFAALSLQNREDAAILIEANTLAPQTAYSTPQVVWRPDGSGVWVNGDDGVVRGVETKTGKVVSLLKQGHEVGYKVRTIWAGWVNVDDGGREEWVLSGGFDKRLIVWRV